MCVPWSMRGVCARGVTLQEQEQDLDELKEEIHRLRSMLETAVTVNARRQAEVQAFKHSVARLLHKPPTFKP